MKPNNKSITEFLSEEYKDFSLYTIENRAIPSYIDGFKPVHRKIIYIASLVWKTGSEKTLKVFQLSGKIASEAQYHHGDMSLNSSIINMAQKFKNNLPLLEEDGQFGSLRSPQPGAPRYIGTKLNRVFDFIYMDSNLLEHKYEEGDKIEPKYLLPIIPMVLVNGSQGIAVGFASNIINRNPIDIITACENHLKGKKIGKINLMIPEFNGQFINDSDNHKRWIIRGIFKRINTTTINISELPPSMTYEKYESLLDDLVDKKLIVSYDDKSNDVVDYTIKFNREQLSKSDDTMIIKLLKLEESQTDNFNTLDEFGKLKTFQTDVEIIESFTNFRLGFYQIRKNKMIDKIDNECLILRNRIIFVKAIITNKIEIKNKKKDDVIKSIIGLKLDKVNDDYDYLLRMPLWSITKEYFDKLKLDLESKELECSEIKKMVTNDMYLKDLSELKKYIKRI